MMDKVKPNYSDRQEKGTRIFRSSVYFKIGNEYKERSGSSRPVDVVLPLILKRKLSLRRERSGDQSERTNHHVDGNSESSDSTFTVTDSSGSQSETPKFEEITMTSKKSSFQNISNEDIKSTCDFTTKNSKSNLSPAFLKAKARFTVKETATDGLKSKIVDKSHLKYNCDKDNQTKRPLEKTVIKLSENSAPDIIDSQTFDLNDSSHEPSKIFSLSANSVTSKIDTDIRNKTSDNQLLSNGIAKSSKHDLPPQFVIKPRRQFVNEGSHVTFKTLFQGSPTPSIEWYRASGEKIENKSPFKIYTSNDFCYLEINKATTQHSGTYTCIITNRAGQASHSMDLDVYAAYKKSKPIPPVVTKPLLDVAAICGSRNIILKCQFNVDGSDVPTNVTWSRSGKALKSDENHQMTWSNGEATLKIAELGIDDSGLYECLLKCPSGEARTSCNLNVEVILSEEELEKQPPMFLCELSDLMAFEGDRIELVVEVQGTPPIDIVWVKDNKEIFLDDPDYIQVQDGTVHKLVIEEALQEDTGEFVCEAYNDYGDTDSFCYLLVKEQPVEPEFIEKPHPISTTEGSIIALSCRVCGVPEPTVRWEKDGIPMKISPRVQIIQDEDIHSVEVSSATLTDCGQYTCVVTNEMGSVSHTVSVHVRRDTSCRLIPSHPVLERIESVSSSESETDIRRSRGQLLSPRHKPELRSPFFTQTLCDQKVLEGQPAVFQCSVEATPAPNVLWFMGKEVIKNSQGYKITFTDSKAQLNIKEVHPEDEGEYTCQASNEVGVVKCTASLLVEDLSYDENDINDIKSVPPKIMSLYPKDVAVMKHQKVTITGHVIGDPSPSITWTKDGCNLSQSDSHYVLDYSHERATLTIKEAVITDRGTYTLRVDNSVGYDESSCSVHIGSVPSPPEGKLQISDVTPTSVTLSWTPSSDDGGSPPLGYTVEMYKCKENTWKILASGLKATTYRAQNLDGETEYRFRVSAENQFGLSEAGLVSPLVYTAVKKQVAIQDTIKCDEDVNRNMKVVEFNTKDNFEDFYEIKEELGKGKFGTVYRCLGINDRVEYAAKIIKCRDKEKVDIRHEVKVMNCLHHDKLLRLVDAFEEPRRMIIVTEVIAGGELFERITNDDFILTEADCVHFLEQICKGVKYMHEQNVIHLDLKPENILCINPKNNLIKIIDFGLARIHKENESMRVLMGTPEFVSPEVINYDEISFKTDAWSIGVITYVLLSGLSPFLGDSDQDTLINVTRAEYDFEDEAFDSISALAKNFIENLLVKNIKKRMSVNDCLEHRWLVLDQKKSSLQRLDTSNLKKFQARRKWQKMANAIKAVGRMSIIARTASQQRFLDASNSPITENGSVSTTNHIVNCQPSDKQPPSTHIRSSNHVDLQTSPKTVSLSSAETLPHSGINPTAPAKLQVIKGLIDVVATRNDRVILQVEVSGGPITKSTWYRDNKEILPDYRRVISTHGSMFLLTINPCRTSDKGQYLFKASNSLGAIESSANLTINFS